MDWINLSNTLIWYFHLFFLGLIFFPLSHTIFGRFFDKGYAMSKTLGILVLSYAAFILGILKIVSFSQTSLFLLVGVAAVVNWYFFKPVFEKKNWQMWGIFAAEEVLFLVSLFFLAYVRGQEPSIRGLEKFMDFGFMNSILKSTYFPPLDMWLSADAARPDGYPINYYYFGHLSGALLIKLTGISPFVGYNLILATILAQSAVLTFSLVGTLVYFFQSVYKKISLTTVMGFGLLGSLLLNMGGNLHPIYLFTTGYPNEKPVPFWQILSVFNPAKYWYPNATRFIPFTIHEFPSYSYVVADLHGHVFDIPFVLLTLAMLFNLFTKLKKEDATMPGQNTKYEILNTIFLGFLAAVHYMTNAFDGPIYLLLTAGVFFLLYRFSVRFFTHLAALGISFILFSLPFSHFFSPFVNGIGVNCSPDFLVKMKKIGPFLFEKGNCQISEWWMLFVLWGFFLISFLFLSIILLKRENKSTFVDVFALLLFAFGTFLIIIPEFFYIKDIYPAHFRANTMFKLGYQAFMMMSIASVFTLFRIRTLVSPLRLLLGGIYIFFLFFPLIYPFFAFPSYYGNLQKRAELDGSAWLASTYLQDKEIVDYINANISGQPVILEAQGDSYTDFERISSYTGLPTVAGWWVHEWLWRGSADVVGKRIPDISTLYESSDINTTRDLLKKYHVKYVVVSQMEKTKYPQLKEDKFISLGKKIFTTSNNLGALYQLNLD